MPSLIFDEMKPLAFLVFTILLFSCKKDTFITSGNARLSTSADTLFFDTVFTTVGSVTHFFRIYNDNDQKLKVSTVQLKGGANSPFKINVDGNLGPTVSNVELEANDSTYVFVTVKIDPTATELPFVIRDSILINYNGKDKWIQLEAWGQNANFFRSRVISTNETWTNNKPYVILGGVQVKEGALLTIQKGCRIYFHADAPMLVDGTLKVMGEKYDSTRVAFRGDRLDEPYRDFPAGWPGIFFREGSRDSELNFATIRNAYQGIVADKPSINANPKVRLTECIIDNCYDAGIFGINSNISARNCLVSNCGKNVVIIHGGTYDFNHCTVASISNNFITHKEGVLLVANFIKEGNTYLTEPLMATFSNSIFWGDNGPVEDEVIVSKQGNTFFQVKFDNCLWKVKTNPNGVVATNIISNQDPLFEMIDGQKQLYNFRLQAGSPAINKGFASGVNSDLDGNARPQGLPDLGAYEKQ